MDIVPKCQVCRTDYSLDYVMPLRVVRGEGLTLLSPMLCDGCASKVVEAVEKIIMPKRRSRAGGSR